MSQNEVDHDPEDVESNSTVPKAKKHDSGAADLERVTDYAEEKEITGQRLSNALAALDQRMSKERSEKIERERELAKVVIKKADVDLIIQELEISRTEAERSLRENKGNLVESLIELTN
ncbi:huntingtin-interacting protein K-like [Patiria miniata]|uniref:Nascent polypeptide-associated complex subunit alpha-like UBA domain-containing protein n=1 Tax=Patiria miniata TaxID=46514 RepID=A0A914BTU8_PATMI|nr:huntingtin-interacting protein K-like [Patiria miniata]